MNESDYILVSDLQRVSAAKRILYDVSITTDSRIRFENDEFIKIVQSLSNLEKVLFDAVSQTIEIDKP